MQADLEPASFEALPDFASDDFVEALACFQRSAKLIASDAPSQRPGVKPGPELVTACRAVLSLGADVSQEKREISSPRIFSRSGSRAPVSSPPITSPKSKQRLSPTRILGFQCCPGHLIS